MGQRGSAVRRGPQAIFFGLRIIIGPNFYWTQQISYHKGALIYFQSENRSLLALRENVFRDRCAFETAKALRFKGACFEIDIRCESLEAKIRRHAKQGASIQK